MKTETTNGDASVDELLEESEEGEGEETGERHQQLVRDIRPCEVGIQRLRHKSQIETQWTTLSRYVHTTLWWNYVKRHMWWRHSCGRLQLYVQLSSINQHPEWWFTDHAVLYCGSCRPKGYVTNHCYNINLYSYFVASVKYFNKDLHIVVLLNMLLRPAIHQITQSCSIS